MNEVTQAIMTANHVSTLSTISADGAPWASPIHYAFDEANIYWVSNSNANHSQNIKRDERVFITIFNSHQDGELPGEKGAIYCATHAIDLDGEQEITARSVYFARYPDRNSEKFQEWSIYGAPIGILDEEKTKGPLVYYVSEGR